MKTVLTTDKTGYDPDGNSGGSGSVVRILPFIRYYPWSKNSGEGAA